MCWAAKSTVCLTMTSATAVAPSYSKWTDNKQLVCSQSHNHDSKLIRISSSFWIGEKKLTGGFCGVQKPMAENAYVFNGNESIKCLYIFGQSRSFRYFKAKELVLSTRTAHTQQKPFRIFSLFAYELLANFQEIKWFLFGALIFNTCRSIWTALEFVSVVNHDHSGIIQVLIARWIEFIDVLINVIWGNNTKKFGDLCGFFSTIVNGLCCIVWFECGFLWIQIYLQRIIKKTQLSVEILYFIEREKKLGKFIKKGLNFFIGKR